MEQLSVSAPDSPELRKARGAFFTPGEICRFIVEWAIRSESDVVLEPSCGDAAFLHAAGARLTALGEPTAPDRLFTFEQIQGIELHEQSARRAAELTAVANIPATILVGDFFDVEPRARYDVVIGNPPYIRYQDFTGDARAKAQQRALAQGVRISGLASSWAPFTVHAAQFLRAGGRMGLVLPAELLAVNYASEIRAFLMERFGSVKLITFNQRVFPGVSEEVVLLLAEGTGPTSHIEIHQALDLDALMDLHGAGAPWKPATSRDKWLPAILPPAAIETYGGLGSNAFSPLSRWGKPYLGAVTGRNQFFALSAARAAELGLESRDLERISPPGSRHLRGLTFTSATWEEMRVQGHRVYLFRPSSTEISNAAAAYVAQGERLGVQRAYKCRVREPWWQVPLVRQPDLFLTYMNHDTPRLVQNEARVRHLNSIHGITLQPDLKSLGERLLPVSCLNSMTLLGAELVGRPYGGGMLKLEPREASQLPVPSPALVRALSDELESISPLLGQALRGGALYDAVDAVDRVLLVDGAGMRRREIRELRDARRTMFDRRSARS